MKLCFAGLCFLLMMLSVRGASVCTDHSFGENCDQTCNCRRSDDVCNKVTGACNDGCAAGYEGVDCNTPCTIGGYGAGCNSRCDTNCRSLSSSRGRTCDHVTGYCVQCRPGYQLGTRDRSCNTPCAIGSYGAGCNSRCYINCIPSTYGGRTCDLVNGYCLQCRPGYQRGTQDRFCNTPCAIGSYGAGCNSRCYINCIPSTYGGRTCDLVNGYCLQCRPGYQRGTQDRFCNTQCAINKYGDRCASSCSANCRLSSPRGGRTCNHVTGHCRNGCDHGYRGDLCTTECVDGSFGLNCTQRCNCIRTVEVCNKATGGCTTGCAVGYQGDDCRMECDIGKYGNGCSSRCSTNCISSRSAGGRTCNHVTGYCVLCRPGYQGNACVRECDIGSYGSGCGFTCRTICRSAISGGRTCNHVTGYCLYCPPGYRGTVCNRECDIGSYGSGCGFTCRTICRSAISGGRTCNHVTGYCLYCPPGYRGTVCNRECEHNYYGNCTAQCSTHCLPESGDQRQCNFVTGICTSTPGCMPGYFGSKCDHECQMDYYGDCMTNCSTHCISVDGGQRQCNFMSGDCTNTTGCHPGYIGSRCDQGCTDRLFGVNCDKTCNCRRADEVCDTVTGACTSGCTVGYHGVDCKTECDNTSYGDGCALTCNANCRLSSGGRRCHIVTGRCSTGCRPGYQGTFCNKALESKNVDGDSSVDGGKIAGIVIGCILGIALIAALIAALVVIYRQRRKLSKTTTAATSTTTQASHGPNRHTYQDLVHKLDTEEHPEKTTGNVADTVIEYETSPDAEGAEYSEIKETATKDRGQHANVINKNGDSVYLTPHTYGNVDTGS